MGKKSPLYYLIQIWNQQKGYQNGRDEIENIDWQVDDVSFGVTTSIGISIVSEKQGDPLKTLTKLLREADTALYDCKVHGKNMVLAFEDLNRNTTRK